jgi:hypothetical protein
MRAAASGAAEPARRGKDGLFLSTNHFVFGMSSWLSRCFFVFL